MKILALRRPDTCVGCGTSLAVGEQAGWDSVAKTVTCMHCVDSTSLRALPAKSASPNPSPSPLDRGTAGRSVTQEAEKRSERHRQREEERVAADQERRSQRKGDHLLAGRFLNTITPKVQAQPAPQHIRAWATGAPGEKKVGHTLDAIPGIMVLHDRQNKPRSQSNIDHIAVTSNGVWVIDTKVRPGKRLEFRNKGGLLSRDERLIVGGRDEPDWWTTWPGRWRSSPTFAVTCWATPWSGRHSASSTQPSGCLTAGPGRSEALSSAGGTCSPSF